MLSIKMAIPLLLTTIIVGSMIFFIKPITSSKYKTEITPTIFVHGFKGGKGSYNTMIQRLRDKEAIPKQMIVDVSPNGDLSIDGRVSPIIQILFQNNRANITQQTIWLQKVIRTLRKKHNVTKLNLVGHSMGGLTVTSFLLNNHKGNYPKVDKLVLIASPFKGIRRKGYFTSNYGPATTDLRPNSTALNDLIKNKENLSHHVDVLSISGVINEEAPKVSQWDGLVHLCSTLGVQDVFPTRNYQEKIVYDDAATHSGLHEHEKVDQILAEFLWKTEKQ